MFKRLLRGITNNGRVLVLTLSIIFVGASLLVTTQMARELHEKEMHDVEVWATAMQNANRMGHYMNDPLTKRIINNRNNIPFIITDENMNVIAHHLIPDKDIKNPERLQRLISDMSEDNKPIEIDFIYPENHRHIIFYGHSTTLKMLYVFPYIQLVVIIIFVLIIFIAFRSTKQNEQNRVWVGLAKETAHQLGTPTSSLLGWIEYLREQPVDQMAVDEMQKDLAHLMKIVDRFSKIGSETPLSTENVNEVVNDSVMYFYKRIPRNVTIEYDGLAKEPTPALLNPALFEWVVENLLKNALDALQGHGAIKVSIGSDKRHVWVDVSDTGKGIAKSKWRRIFEPGYTTKTRGWGLGLSLSRRIIEDYHHGHIAVVSSELGVGTTFRITLKRAQKSK